MRLASAASILALALLVSASARASDEFTPHPPPSPRKVPAPDASYVHEDPGIHLTIPWFLTQLVPSPELVFGRTKHVDPTGAGEEEIRTAFGMRWQVTPVLWSFGVHRSVSRWRTFVVDPIARHSGSLELSATFEYVGGHVDRLLARPGLRVYLPVAHRGEYLSVSLGTNAYAYDGLRVAYEVGAYILSGVLGLQLTAAPAHDPMAGIATLRFRYF